MTTPNVVVFTEDYIKARLASELPQWEYRDGWIRRKYKTGGWPFSLMVANAVGYIAEASWHHPDLLVSWGEVTVKLNTHSEKGITEKDFAVAKKVEEALLWLPAEGGALEGFEAGFKKKWTR